MKKIIINSCNECPHFKPKALDGYDDSYEANCKHPDVDTEGWVVKIKNICTIPSFCPLETIDEVAV